MSKEIDEGMERFIKWKKDCFMSWFNSLSKRKQLYYKWWMENSHKIPIEDLEKMGKTN